MGALQGSLYWWSMMCLTKRVTSWVFHDVPRLIERVTLWVVHYVPHKEGHMGGLYCAS